jgi:hypothetical protein
VSGREVTSTNTDAGSGSSSVLSSAFSAADHERIGWLDDGHAFAAFEGPKDRLLDRRPYLLDLDRPAFARLDDHHVGMRTAGDAAARRTLAARAAIVHLQTVELLRDRDGDQAFADSLWAGQDKARRQRLARNGLREQPYEAAMADNVPKCHYWRMLPRRSPARTDGRSEDTVLELNGRHDRWRFKTRRV